MVHSGDLVNRELHWTPTPSHEQYRAGLRSDARDRMPQPVHRHDVDPILMGVRAPSGRDALTGTEAGSEQLSEFPRPAEVSSRGSLVSLQLECNHPAVIELDIVTVAGSPVAARVGRVEPGRLLADGAPPSHSDQQA